MRAYLNRGEGGRFELECDLRWESKQFVAFLRVGMHFALEKEPAAVYKL